LLQGALDRPQSSSAAKDLSATPRLGGRGLILCEPPGLARLTKVQAVLQFGE